MARPTDPEKLAALRARQAANSRAYRQRQAQKRATEQPTVKPPRQAPATEAAVQRAHDARTAAKNRRSEIIGGFTSARNPRVNIYTPREIPTAPAAIPESAARRRQRIKVLRENTEAQRLQNVGRRRKAEISDFERHDPRAETIMENLRAHGGQEFVSRFRAATKSLAGVSQQTLAILLQYEGGEGDFQSALTQIAYPKSSDVEDALGRIEVLAETAQRAEGLYGPKAVGRLRI